MPPLRRRLTNLLTALSLLLCAAVVALWVRSYGPGDTWTAWERDGPQNFSDTCQLESARGGLTVYRSVSTAGTSPLWFPPGRGNAPLAIAEKLGFRVRYSMAYRDVFNTQLNGTLGTYRRAVRIPYWPFVAVTSGVPALRMFAHVRRRRRHELRRAKGLCTACGFDLTANVSGVCPECGVTLRA